MNAFLARQTIRNFLELALEFPEKFFLNEITFKWGEWEITITYSPDDANYVLVMTDLMLELPPIVYQGSLRSCYHLFCQTVGIE